jgi:hypothetical protein
LDGLRILELGELGGSWGQVLKYDIKSGPMIARRGWVWLAMYEFKT